MKRRAFLTTMAAAGCGACSVHASDNGPVDQDRRLKLLLRSSWQVVNIGDIAHTPGMLAILEKYRPDVEVTLWPSSVEQGVDKMLLKRFPTLQIVSSKSEHLKALAECDFFLHGSGPGLVAAKDCELARAAGKPYGFGGVTLNDQELVTYKQLMDQAKFVYLRDTDSMQALIASGVSKPTIDFGPDATFGIDIKNDKAADDLIAAQGLTPGEFLCAIPRLRYTPYWEIHPEREAEPERIRVNDQYREIDAEKLRAAVTAWVRETGKQAFLVPEMTYEVPLLKSLIFDRLPNDVKPRVRYMTRYWLTDEAVSLYSKAAMLVSCEQHSPIMCISQGVPAVLLRQPTDTRKGRMWYDLGMRDWVFEIDDASAEEIASRVVGIGQSLSESREKAKKARQLAQDKMAAMVRAI